MTDSAQDQDTGATTPEGRNLTAKTLIGNPVKNRQGEALGKVQDFMLDLESGRIAYAVVSYGGVMGLGGKLFAVPWSAFALDTNDHTFVLNVDRDVLSSAEGFDKKDWPNVADRDWGGRIHHHYGTRPYWDER